jgi:hypothetical protein
MHGGAARWAVSARRTPLSRWLRRMDRARVLAASQRRGMRPRRIPQLPRCLEPCLPARSDPVPCLPPQRGPRGPRPPALKDSHDVPELLAVRTLDPGAARRCAHSRVLSSLYRHAPCRQPAVRLAADPARAPRRRGCARVRRRRDRRLSSSAHSSARPSRSAAAAPARALSTVTSSPQERPSQMRTSRLRSVALKLRRLPLPALRRQRPGRRTRSPGADRALRARHSGPARTCG